MRHDPAAGYSVRVTQSRRCIQNRTLPVLFRNTIEKYQNQSSIDNGVADTEDEADWVLKCDGIIRESLNDEEPG